MTRAAAGVSVLALGALLAGTEIGGTQPFPSAGSPNPAMTGAPAAPPRAASPAAAPSDVPPPNVASSARTTAADKRPGDAAPAASSPTNGTAPSPAGSPPPEGAPQAVKVARATAIPACTVFVDAAAPGGGAGTAERPLKTIGAAVAAARTGAVICVAEGVYPEAVAAGEKGFTLAGGFQRGRAFTVRDSAAFVSKAAGRGGSFLRIVEPGPKGDQLTAIDGFEITGYSQAILRDYYENQRFDITNNFIHDNTCRSQELVGAAFALTNTSGTIAGNVIRRNACGRGGGGAVVDDIGNNTILIANNHVDANAGTEPVASHGGGLYLFANRLMVTANLFTDNTVTQWGGGLYVGAFTQGKKFTNATMSWNVYRSNRAGHSGGGFFCDEAATCASEHEVYAGNCGGNILLDGAQDDSGPSSATFDHVTVVGALDPACQMPGVGVLITKDTKPAATYSFTNALFWGNAKGQDLAAYCNSACERIKVTVAQSMVQTEHTKDGMAVAFGAGITTPADPLFADPARGDFHLRSAAGRWTPAGHLRDEATSPALGKGGPRGPKGAGPERAGDRSELGAYGNSLEASYVR